jgi:hypothetical protein
LQIGDDFARQKEVILIRNHHGFISPASLTALDGLLQQRAAAQADKGLGISLA